MGAVDRLSLAGWSIHRRFQRERDPLDLVDFPAVAKEEFGFDTVELNSLFFLSTDGAYLQELSDAARRAGVAFSGITVDGTGDPSAFDEGVRRESVRRALPWFHISNKLGLPMLRINTGGNGAEQDPRAVDQCVKSMRELVRAAEESGVRLLIENHGGISVNPLNVVRIVEEVGHPMLGTLPDFGNFPDAERPRFLALARLRRLGLRGGSGGMDRPGRVSPPLRGKRLPPRARAGAGLDLPPSPRAPGQRRARGVPSMSEEVRSAWG